jgi:hypothetical protein
MSRIHLLVKSYLNHGGNKPGKDTAPTLLAWLILGIVIFCAHFVLVSQFGVYEDDFFYVVPWLHASSSKLWNFGLSSLLHPSQGRPFLAPAQALLANLGFKIGGLEFCHLISFFVLWLSAILLYQLLRPKLGRAAALIGGFVLVLFPLDTSRQIIMHQMATLIPMAALLWCILLYRARQFVAAYILAAMLLLTYESTYLPFLIAPVFLDTELRSFFRRFSLHLVIWAVIAAGVFSIRAFLGESRATQTVSGISEFLPKIVQASAIGPAYGLLALLTRPVDSLFHSTAEGYLLAAICGGLVYLALCRSRDITTEPTQQALPIWLIAGSGLLVWVIAYLLSFRPDYFPPVVSIGRLSAQHNVAGLGAAVVTACGYAFLAKRLKAKGRTVSDIVVALFAAGLVAFGYHIQDAEYVGSWKQVRSFWLRLFPLIQDARPGDVIVFQFDDTKHGIVPITKGFTQHEMAVYYSLAFPRFVTWTHPGFKSPTFHGYADYTRIIRKSDEAIIESPSFDPTAFAHVREDNLIFLQSTKGKLRRLAGPIVLQGVELYARPQDTSIVDGVKPSSLFWELFEPVDSSRWSTLKNARSYPG